MARLPVRVPMPHWWAAEECFEPGFLGTLSEEERLWWRDFVATYYANSQNGLQSVEQMRERFRAHNASQRDVYSLKAAVGEMQHLGHDHLPELALGDVEDRLIAALDGRKERNVSKAKASDAAKVEELPTVTSWASVKVKGGWMPTRITSVGMQIVGAEPLEEKAWPYAVAEEACIRDMCEWPLREAEEAEAKTKEKAR